MLKLKPAALAVAVMLSATYTVAHAGPDDSGTETTTDTMEQPVLSPPEIQEGAEEALDNMVDETQTMDVQDPEPVMEEPVIIEQGDIIESPAPENTEAPMSEETSEMDEGEKPDILGLASSDENLTTLAQAVAASGLTETLQSDGPFTVFAPSNLAFSGVPADDLQALLLPDNQDQLASILTFHVIASEVSAADLVAQIEANDGYLKLETVNGTPLKAVMAEGDVYLIDNKGEAAKVEATDIGASNGVVHVINQVMMPN